MQSLRAVRSLRSALPKSPKSVISHQLAARTLSVSSRLHSDAHADPPPALFGEGAKAGQVPSDEQQATGLERLQLLGQMAGVDVFHTGPLVLTKPGTMEDPTIVNSYSEERVVGCTGFPTDSHDLLWLVTNNHKEHHRCPECGNVYKMNFLGVADAHHH